MSLTLFGTSSGSKLGSYNIQAERRPVNIPTQVDWPVKITTSASSDRGCHLPGESANLP